MKKSLLFLLLFFISACSFYSSKDDAYYYCPYVKIPRDSAYLTQKNNYSDDFQIEVKGFEGYCYFDEKVKVSKAVIAPIFEIKKLQPVKDTELDFKFFTKTLVGPPEFLGVWQHSQSAKIKEADKIVELKGKPIEMRIPDCDNDKFEILLGLVQSPKEKAYNQKTFDIDYKYKETIQYNYMGEQDQCATQNSCD